MTDTANAPEHSKMRRMIYENRSHLAPQCVWLAYSEAAEGGDLCLEDEFLSEEDFADLQHKPPKYVLATHCDELVAAAYMDAAQVLEDEIDLARIALPQAVPVLRADIRAIKNRTPTKAKVALTARDERMKAEGAREAQAKIARLTEALEFYADDNRTGLPSDGPWGLGSNDFGSRARAALQENVDE